MPKRPGKDSETGTHLDGVIVIKMGGVVLEKGDTTVADIVHLQKRGKRLVIVHGGGNLVTEWLSRQGIATRFVRGERVTDGPTLDIAIAVLAGLANKQFVAAVNSAGGRAIGISGVDGGLIQAKVRDKEMGYVGMVVKVNPKPIETLLAGGYIPVISPLGLNVESGGDTPSILNINGDPVAGEIAAAVGAERLVFLTDVAGVCDREGAPLGDLSAAEAEGLIASGVASGGMIPKIKACVQAVSTSALARIVDGRESHALLREIEGQCPGTTIHR